MNSPRAPQTTHPAPDGAWFKTEVHAHEAALRTYLRGSFPRMRDVDDVVQESYLRVWRAAAAQQIKSTKAFLFTVARRLALDWARNASTTRVDHVGHLDELSVVQEDANPADALGRQERIELLAEAIAGLPTRCREVFLVYKIGGRSRREAAAQLGLSEKTVEVHTARAMRHCEAFFARRGMKGVFEHERQ